MKPVRRDVVVRLPLVVLVPLRAYFQLTARLAPGVAVGAFRWLLTHMPRKRLSARDQQFLRGGQRMDLDCGDAVLAGYSFGAGPTVLLVHGLQGSAADFRALAPALAAAGYRVVAFDSVSHGNSPAGVAFSRRSIEHVRQVMARLGPLHAVVSHSAGAYLSMLALLQPPPGCSVAKCVYVAPYPDIATTLRTFTDYFWVPRAVEPQLQRWFEDIGGLPFDQQSMRYCLPRHRTPQVPECLFIHDTDDRHIPLDCTRRTLAQLEGARLHVTTGLGHFRVLKEGGVIAHIVAFLNRL
jgi:pimeloyl-ACP methyl ester carboxylesterase